MCDELPECEIQCDGLSDEDGNDQSTLKPTIHRACCTCEWWCAQQHDISTQHTSHTDNDGNESARRRRTGCMGSY